MLFIHTESAIATMFVTLGSVLSWFLTNNPARCRSFNPFEPHSGGSYLPEDFSTEHPQRLFCEILNSIYGALSNNSRDARLIFNLCELGRPFGSRLHPRDVAKLIHISERTAYRLLRRIKDDLHEDLQRRNILKVNKDE